MSQFYSAWVSETATTWLVSYKRKDLDIASLIVEQSENNCATLKVTVRNPQIGLLAPGRLVWLWLAWENDSGVTTPIFFGRLIPVPNLATSTGEAAMLSFIARPLDFDIQRAEVALMLQVFPYYDPIFIDPTKRLTFAGTAGYNGDPDTVLEGWARLWSIDRVTGVVDTSDILQGEDGTEVFNSSEIPEASIQLNTATSILTDLTVIGNVNWAQSLNSPGPVDAIPGFSVSISGSATNGLDLISSWPKLGASFGGFTVRNSAVVDAQFIVNAQVQQKGWRYENKAKQHHNGDVMSISWNYAEFPSGVVGDTYIVSESIQRGTPPGNPSGGLGTISATPSGGDADANIPFHYNASIMMIAQVPFSCSMTLIATPSSASNSNRSETLTLKLVADIQPLIVLPISAATPSAAASISVSGANLNVPVDGLAPVAVTGSNYFPTSRGAQSIEYLIAIGVAHLKSANRAVQISWDTTFERAIALSCRKNATINARLIPGGTATGKIIGYSLSASGLDLQLKGNVTIGCCIGNGATGTVSGSTGTDELAVPGTLLDSVAVHSSASNVFAPNTSGAGDVAYSPPFYVPQPGEPIVPLQASQMIIEQSLTDELVDVNIGTSILPDGSQGPPATVKVPIKVFNLELFDLSVGASGSGNAFASGYEISTTPVKLPKQIDLTVPSW